MTTITAPLDYYDALTIAHIKTEDLEDFYAVGLSPQQLEEMSSIFDAGDIRRFAKRPASQKQQLLALFAQGGFNDCMLIEFTDVLRAIDDLFREDPEFPWLISAIGALMKGRVSIELGMVEHKSPGEPMRLIPGEDVLEYLAVLTQLHPAWPQSIARSQSSEYGRSMRAASSFAMRMQAVARASLSAMADEGIAPSFIDGD